MLTIGPDVLQRLSALKRELTFGPTADGMYTGVFDSNNRAKCNAYFAELIDQLVAGLQSRPSEKFVFATFRSTWKKLPVCDTEDRERAVGYFEVISKALEIENYGAFLNRLLYGPILGRLLNARRR